MKLISTIGFDTKLLPKFVQYYRGIGIEQFHFILNSDDPFHIDSVKSTLWSMGIKLGIVWSEEFSEKLKIEYERSYIDTVFDRNDWVIYADLDEFQVYANKKGLISTLKSTKKDYLEGKMIDRVSATGELLDIKPDIKLEEQFPLGGHITGPLMGAWDKKIVAAKAYKRVGGGHHVFLRPAGELVNGYNTYPYTPEVAPHSRGIYIHHFKWDGTVIPRMLREREYKDDSLLYWKKEMGHFLLHIKIHDRINIKSKKMKFKKIGVYLGV